MQPAQVVRDAGLDAVIGMYPTVHRLRTTVVAPWAGFRLGDTAVRPPHRVLLHGAPGCGATYIAGQLVDELATAAGVTAVVVDDVDEIVARDPAELTAILTGPEARDVVLVAVSHEPWAIPTDLFGDGGFERMAFVPPPDWDARRFRIWETSWGRGLSGADLDRVVVATEGWTGADLSDLADLAAVSTADLTAALADRSPRSQQWLTRSRDLVRSLESYGRVDDLVGYLQRYRLL